MKKKKRLLIKSIILLLPTFILLGIIILAGKKLFNQKYYEISSRKGKVKETVIKSETNTYSTIGWVKVQGTNIDLPIISNDEESYPVEIEGYTWLDKALSSYQNYTSILGHNVFNLSSNPLIHSKEFKRFEELMYFVDYDFAKENKYFQITMNNEDKLYKIFMVGFVPKSEELFGFTEENYLERLKELSIFDYNIDVNKNDKIVSLVTCSRFFGQTLDKSFYVVGREVRKNEKINNYSLKRNKNYEEIKIILDTQGGSENEA